MGLSESFDPVYKPDAKVLVLGSMPGLASLDAQEYYAHPRNLFWHFMSELCSEVLPETYDQKIALLHRNQVALWDVLQSCDRAGSLDANIVASSEQANDFPTLLAQLPNLKGILFNGKKAESSFFKHVYAKNTQQYERLRIVALPSTSPANASQGFESKLLAWRKAFALILQGEAVHS